MLTTDELAERLNTTRQAIYNSRAKAKPPGSLGIRRGKRLVYDPDTIDGWLTHVELEETDASGTVVAWVMDEGYGEPETTNEPTTAILWALEGIHTTLRAIEKNTRPRPKYGGTGTTTPAVLKTPRPTMDEWQWITVEEEE